MMISLWIAIVAVFVALSVGFWVASLFAATAKRDLIPPGHVIVPESRVIEPGTHKHRNPKPKANKKLTEQVYQMEE
jgi:hypothetical protein